MTLQETILLLNKLIPVLGTVTGNPAILTLAQQLIAIANGQLESQAAAGGKTTEQILADASAKWDQALQNAKDLKNM